MLVESDIELSEETEDEDFYLERNYTFRYEGTYIKIFKETEESYKHVLLKMLAYILFRKKYESLEINCDKYQKHQPDLIAFDYEQEPVFWAECGDIRWPALEYVCKNKNIKEIAIIQSEDDISELLQTIKTRIPEKFLKKIKIINFLPMFVNDWLDPSDVILVRDWLEVTSF